MTVLVIIVHCKRIRYTYCKPFNKPRSSTNITDKLRLCKLYFSVSRYGDGKSYTIYVICHLSNWPLIASIESLIDQLVVLTPTDHCFLWNCIACIISRNILHKNWSLCNFRVCILQSRKPRNSRRQLHWQSKMSSVSASPHPRTCGKARRDSIALLPVGGVGRRDGDISDYYSVDGKANENLAKFPADVRPC